MFIIITAAGARQYEDGNSIIKGNGESCQNRCATGTKTTLQRLKKILINAIIAICNLI